MRSLGFGSDRASPAPTPSAVPLARVGGGLAWGNRANALALSESSRNQFRAMEEGAIQTRFLPGARERTDVEYRGLRRAATQMEEHRRTYEASHPTREVGVAPVAVGASTGNPGFEAAVQLGAQLREGPSAAAAERAGRVTEGGASSSQPAPPPSLFLLIWQRSGC